MKTVTPPDYDEICKRLHKAVLANNYLEWRAIGSWLASISIMCSVDGMPKHAELMRIASDLAMQKALDIQRIPIQQIDKLLA